jgi:hypothetical protein
MSEHPLVQFQHSQMKPKFHLLLPIQCDRESHHNLSGTSKKVTAEDLTCVLYAPMNIFGTHLVQNLWETSLTVMISWKMVSEICGNSYKSFEIVKHCFSPVFLVNTWNKITTHHRWLTTSLFIVNIFPHCIIFPSLTTIKTANRA